MVSPKLFNNMTFSDLGIVTTSALLFWGFDSNPVCSDLSISSRAQVFRTKGGAGQKPNGHHDHRLPRFQGLIDLIGWMDGIVEARTRFFVLLLIDDSLAARMNQLIGILNGLFSCHCLSCRCFSSRVADLNPQL